eukprot:2596828-Ditylum_brightwellii.AAC.1
MTPISTQHNPNIKRAVIAFQQPQARQLKRGQYHTYKLCTTPANATSPIYKLSVPFFDNRTPKEWIKFQHRLHAVLKGQNNTQGPPKLRSCQDTSQGQCINSLQTEHMFPEKAGQTQKHYMCRNLWLVGEMTVKEWVDG